MRLHWLLRQGSDGAEPPIAATFSQGHRISDWGFVLSKQRMGKGKEGHVLSIKAVGGSARWAEPL